MPSSIAGNRPTPDCPPAVKANARASPLTVKTMEGTTLDNTEHEFARRLGGHRLTRRKTLVAGGALATGLTFGLACGDDDDDPGSPATNTPAAGETAEPTQKPQQGGSLVVGGRIESIWSGAPYQIASTYLELFNSVNDTLFRYTTADLEFEPRLAEGYEFNTDETEITVTLKNGITFHDGKPINAQAVVDGLASLNAKDTPTSQVRSLATAYVESASAVDPRTVLFKLKRPGRLVFDVFHYFAIVDVSTIANAVNGQPWNGSGPFKMTNVRPQQGCTMVRHDGHWSPPVLDSFEYRIFSDPAALAIAVDAGEVDLAKDVSADDFERFKSQNGYTVLIDQGLQAFYSMGMNAKGAVTGDPRIRRALYHALDRQRISEDVFLRVTQPTNSLWPKSSPAYEARYDADQFDLDLARKLVREAGYENGTPSIPYMCASTNFEGQRFFEIFQADAAEAGLNLKLTLTDAAAFSEQFQNATYPGMYTTTFGFNALTPDTLPLMNFQVRRPNSAGFDSPKYEDFIARLAAAKTSEERQELYKEFNQIWDENMWVMCVTDRRVQWVAGKNVASFQLSDWSIPLLDKAGRA